MKNKTAKIEKDKNNKKRLWIVVALVAVVGVAYTIFSMAAAPGTPAFGFYASPSTSSPAAGTQFNVSIYANMGGRTTIQSIAAYLHYDPTLLRLDSANQTGVPVSAVMCTGAVNDGCKPAGDILFSTYKTGTQVIPATEGILLGNLTFTALKKGTANLTFDAGAGLTAFGSVNNPTPTTEQADLDSRTLQNGVYTLRDATPPPAPASLSSPSKTVTTVNLSWNAVVDEVGGSGLAGYRVYDGATQVGTQTTATTAVVTGLAPSSAHSFTVKAIDNDGNLSAASNTLAVTTNADVTAPTVPAAPTKVSSTMTSINLTWAASTDVGGGGVTGYRIFRNGVAVGTTATTTFSDTGRLPGTSYNYTVTAYDAAANESAQSTAAALTTSPDTELPTAPTNLLNTTPSNGSVTLSWTGSTDNDVIAGYQVLKNNIVIFTTPANVLTYTDNGLTAGSYTYTVKATDRTGNVSSASNSKVVSIFSSIDLNQDGIVGVADLNIVLVNYGRSGVSLTGDANGDGVVNIQDMSLILNKWGTAG